MPLHPVPDRCAMIVNDHLGRPSTNCPRPPTRRGTWTFDYPKRHVNALLLCDDHAHELGDDPRLTLHD